MGRCPVSGAGGASRRSSLTYPAFVEQPHPKRSGLVVDAMLIASGFAMVGALVLLVMQIG